MTDIATPIWSSSIAIDATVAPCSSIMTAMISAVQSVGKSARSVARIGARYDVIGGKIAVKSVGIAARTDAKLAESAVQSVATI